MQAGNNYNPHLEPADFPLGLGLVEVHYKLMAQLSEARAPLCPGQHLDPAGLGMVCICLHQKLRVQAGQSIPFTTIVLESPVVGFPLDTARPSAVEAVIGQDYVVQNATRKPNIIDNSSCRLKSNGQL